METILYFYNMHKSTQNVYLKRYDMGYYLLLKVGLGKGMLRLLQEHPATERFLENTAEELAEAYKNCKRRERKINRQQDQELMNLLQYLWQNILPFAHFGQPCSCVYEEPLQNHGFAMLWDKYSCFPRFDAYKQDRWARPVLGYCMHTNLVIFGFEPCLHPFLLAKAKHLKSLRWYLPEPQNDETFSDFEEDFYEESGMTIDLQPLQEGELVEAARVPTSILDCTGRAYTYLREIPKGSILVDLTSSDIQRRRLEKNQNLIAYHSLKKSWNQF